MIREYLKDAVGIFVMMVLTFAGIAMVMLGLAALAVWYQILMGVVM